MTRLNLVPENSERMQRALYCKLLRNPGSLMAVDVRLDLGLLSHHGSSYGASHHSPRQLGVRSLTRLGTPGESAISRSASLARPALVIRRAPHTRLCRGDTSLHPSRSANILDSALSVNEGPENSVK